MAFMHPPCPVPSRRRIDDVLPADNATGSRFGILALLRRAAPGYGLKPPVLTTLEALLSCLSPRQDHHVVFASNATLTFRRNGIADRTVRRHIAALEDAGFLQRVDSPNGKRFTRHNPLTGEVLRFGFDLEPLFTRHREIEAMAQETELAQTAMQFLKLKLRALVQQRLADNPACAIAQDTLRALRRKLSLEQITGMHSAVTEGKDADNTVQHIIPSGEMSASDSQNVRHYQNSNKEPFDSDCSDAMTIAEPENDEDAENSTLDLRQVLGVCPAATEFADAPLRNWPDAIRHAWRLAPMMGVDQASLQASQERLGPVESTVTLFAVLQMQGSVAKMGAYFRAITSGTRSDGFDPWALIRRLMRKAAVRAELGALSADNAMPLGAR